MKNAFFASVTVSVHAAVYNLWDVTAAKFPGPGGDTDYLLKIYKDKS